MSSLLDKLTGKSHHHDNDSHSAATSGSSAATHSHSSSTMASNPATSTTTTNTTTHGAHMNNNNNMANTSVGSTHGHNTHDSSLTVGTGQQVGHGYSGTGTNTDEAMTRSEERLRVGKETVEAGVAALDKYVTTEHVEKSVPVTKERVVIEREPITNANAGAAMSGAAITEAHHEVHLKEERALAAKEVVPIERIRLAKQSETHQETVGADLRKEHVDLTTTGINEKFDNVGYGVTTGQKIDDAAHHGTTAHGTTGHHATTTTTSHNTTGAASNDRTGQY